MKKTRDLVIILGIYLLAFGLGFLSCYRMPGMMLKLFVFDVVATIVVYLTMLPFSVQHWYYGIGCLSVAVLFQVVSIPLMERRQLSRRPQYREYQYKTSRLLLRPQKALQSEELQVF